MDVYEKLELWIENTKNISELRDAFIETINNNECDLEAIYNIHKKSVDIQVNKDHFI